MGTMARELEIWKDITGYEGLYQVSNLGNVKSLNYNKTGKEKILKGGKGKDGYLQVVLCKEDKRKTHTIHRLVATAFIDNPNNLPQVNHIDENNTNNCVDNLEWCNCKYNINYGTRNKRVSKAQENRKDISKLILQFTKDGDFVRRWNSVREVERELGIYHSNISNCCKGKYKTAGGYKWGYADDYEQILFKVFDIELYRKKIA